jgi:hypothetical protein
MCESSVCFKLQNWGGWLAWQSRNEGSGGTTYRLVCVWLALSAAACASRLHGQLECLAVEHMALLQGRYPRLVRGGHASVGASRRGCFGACACGKCCGDAVEPEATIRKMKHVLHQNALQVLETRAAAAGRAREAR